MRLLLSLLPLLIAISPARGQSEGFDPYQAALDRMPIEQARPMLEAEYGPLEDGGPTMHSSFANEKVLTLFGPDEPAPNIFIFCEGKLSGFSAVLSPQAAADILNPATARTEPAPEVYASGSNVSIYIPATDTSFQYGGIGTQSSYVSVSHPTRPFVRFEVAELCQAGSREP